MAVYLVQFVNLLGTILYLAMLGRVILSWVNLSTTNPIRVIIFQITEPILSPIRRILPRMGALDLSPMIGIILIRVVQEIIKRVIQI
ncbi:MAG: YggT family protein [Chloroflexi bacterium]|nr:YggT family protein [Chloroflexota bacterium]MDA1227638.1 YggT family protein [Chloroflexota bacterium]